MECVLWTREKSLSKEKSGFYQHVAIAKAITPQWLPRAPCAPIGDRLGRSGHILGVDWGALGAHWGSTGAPWEAIGG